MLEANCDAVSWILQELEVASQPRSPARGLPNSVGGAPQLPPSALLQRLPAGLPQAFVAGLDHAGSAAQWRSMTVTPLPTCCDDTGPADCDELSS